MASIPMLTSIDGKLSVDGRHSGGIDSCLAVTARRAGECSASGEYSSRLVAAVECLAGSGRVAIGSTGAPPVWGMVAPRWHTTRKHHRPQDASDPRKCGACGGVSMTAR